MADKANNPRATSFDYDEMEASWHLVNAVLEGVEAMRATTSVGNVTGPVRPAENLASIRRGIVGPESPYLPRLIDETTIDYERRRRMAPLTNIYSDISNNLASKPFSKTCELDDGASSDLKDLQQNIDGKGNNLHVFAGEVFKSGIDKAIDWVLVDYPRVPPGATLDAERKMGARPYWVHVPAERVLAVRSYFLGREEIINHVRIYEPCVVTDGYLEKMYERVRVFNRDPIVQITPTGDDRIIGFKQATWELFELQEKTDASNNKTQEWVSIDSGAITIGIIPMVPFVPGKRNGTSWKISFPILNLAHMQVEEFQKESNLKSIEEKAAFPMLAGNGVSPPKDQSGTEVALSVGPNSVLFAPMDANGHAGAWALIEPAATSMTYLKGSLEKFQDQMRDLGMQPLTASNLTVITTANVSQKSHSACQAWALKLKDMLEQCWKITCQWLKRDQSPIVKVHVDFDVMLDAGPELTAIKDANNDGVISKKLRFDELKRRGVLHDDADWDDDQEEVAEEQQGMQPEVAIDPLTGKPLNVDPLTGLPRAVPPQPKPPTLQ